jgi:Phage tail tube protein
MPQILYPSEVILTEGTKLDLGWLQTGTRVPVTYALSVVSTATAGSTQVSLQSVSFSPSNILIQAGTVLPFVTGTIVVAQDVIFTQAETSTLVSISKPLSAPLSASDLAQTKALLTVLGLKEASPQGQTQTVDVSNFLSGFGQENVVTGVNRTLTCSGFVIKGDRATDRIIKQLILNDEKARREVYAELNLPSGERYEGAAKIENYNTTTNVRNVQEFSFSLMFQGASFVHTPATEYTPVAQDL